jgi:outer membrane protein assembly factor BamB
MDHEDTYFTPEAVDEQIDRLGSDSPLATSSSPNARLLQDLRALHQADEARLENIWDRLAQRAEYGDRTDKLPIDIQYYQQRRLQDQQQRQAVPAPSQKTSGRRFSLLLTQLIAAVIIGSLLLVPAWMGYQQTMAPNLNQAKQELASQSIYVSSDQGVLGVDASTGRGHWTYTIPDYSLGLPVNPIVENGFVYAESQDSIYAIDARTGALRWSHTFPSQISPYPTNKSRPVLFQNAIYVSVVLTEVNKLDASTGRILQTYRPQLNTNIVSIAIEKNVLYAFGLFDMCALRLTDGKTLWCRQSNQSQVLGVPHIQNGVLYTIASSDVTWPYVNPKSTSHIEAFEANSGNLLWQSNTIQGSVTDISIDGGMIYNGSTDGSITAYDMKTGTQVWSKTIAGLSFSGSTGPQIDRDTLYMAAQDPTMSYQAIGIVALDTSNGHLRWQYPSDFTAMKRAGHMFKPPVVQNGVVFVNDGMSGQYTSELYALFSGAVLWHRTIDNKS